MQLIKGVLINPTKLQTQIVYNMNAPENTDISTTDGVLVEQFLELSAIGITPQRGKGYKHYVNPITKEQWFEEYDRPLTDKDLAEIQGEKIDLLLQMQMAAQNII